MGGDAALGGEQHQVVGADADAHGLARRVVDVAGEDGFQLGAGRQLQAVERRGAEEGPGGDARL